MEHSSIKLSRRSLLQLAAGASAAMLGSSLPEAWGREPQKREASAQFQNPLFAGDHPDVTVLRVGDDFYFTNTSYHYAPGLIVWHSRDLVNWIPISSALAHTYGAVWAPDLQYYQGQYLIYFALDEQIHVVHATDPHGPWSAPINLNLNDIDPGHVVGPDGTRYLYMAGGHMVQLSADGLSAIGTQQYVYHGWPIPKDWVTQGTWLEGPKLTKRGQYYYMTSAEGGTAGPPTSHMAIVARSQSPLGPWENSPYNPLIHTYSADETWWSVGHATLFSTPNDRWYIMYHGYRNGLITLGRQTLMEPIEWRSDGWPRAPLGTKRDQPMPAPMGVPQRPMITLSDDFRSPSLRLTWGAWNEMDMSRFQVGHGTLTVRAKGDTAGDSSPLTIQARDGHYAVQVTAMPQSGCGAALGLFYNVNNWLFTELKNGQARLYGANQTLASRAWKGSRAYLKIINRDNAAAFLVSENGHDWQALAADVDVSGFNNNALGGFQALRPALAAPGLGEARFADFSYRPL